MGRCFFPRSPIDLTPAGEVGSWATIQCNPYVNVNSTGAIVHYYDTGGSVTQLYHGLRRHGGSAGIGWERQNGHAWAIVGLDGLRRFDYFRGSSTQRIKLVGYTVPGVEFFINELDITPGVKGSWQTHDLSGSCPGAIAIIFRMINLEWVDHRAGGIRANGSAQDTFGQIYRTNEPARYNHIFGISKCDASQIVQVKIENLTPTVAIFASGYITAGASFVDTFVDKSITVNGYKEIDISDIDPGAGMAFIKVVTSGLGYKSALRRKGSSEDLFNYQFWSRSFAFIEVDGEGKLEGKVDSNNTDFWIMGTAEGPPPNGLHGFPMPQIGGF